MVVYFEQVGYAPIIANTLIVLLRIALGTANAEEKYSRYEKQDYWFSILYPTSWKLEETKLGYKCTVKFLGGSERTNGFKLPLSKTQI